MSRARRHITASALLFGLIQVHANVLARQTLTIANAGTHGAIPGMPERASQGFFKPRVVQNTEAETSNSVTAGTRSHAILRLHERFRFCMPDIAICGTA